MRNKLYHSEVFFPDWLKKRLPKERILLTYSNHALKAANNDRYGNVKLPQSIGLANGYIFEVETQDKTITKLAIRYPLKGGLDITFVLLYNSGIVKTVWLNKRSDVHKTLERSKYESE